MDGHETHSDCFAELGLDLPGQILLDEELDGEAIDVLEDGLALCERSERTTYGVAHHSLRLWAVVRVWVTFVYVSVTTTTLALCQDS